jgi:hypothetical protein
LGGTRAKAGPVAEGVANELRCMALGKVEKL